MLLTSMPATTNSSNNSLTSNRPAQPEPSRIKCLEHEIDSVQTESSHHLIKSTVFDVLCSDDKWYRARVTKTRGNKARLLFADDEWACLRFPRDLHAVRFITGESGEAAAVKTSSPSSSRQEGKDVKASDATSDSESTDVGSVVGYETD